MENFEEVLNMFAVEYDKELEFKVIREESIEIKAKETAIKMLQKNFDKSIIAEIINMPISWIEEIAKSNKI